MGKIIAHTSSALHQAGAVFHIILYEPEIPPNTGNIIRLCANTGCRLHLVGPLGFELDSRSVRRAGLDYSELASVSTYPDLATCLQRLPHERLFAVETAGEAHYASVNYRSQDAFLFGPETRGLPSELLASLPPQQRVSIPMLPGNRSLNLSNAVSVVIYEAWRQNAFALPAAAG
jgi:tRNA (cytidine/uridine-2'-O-)-methyltransferase